MVRVAVIQIESTSDASSLFESCTRMIDRAVVEQAARIVVFPELTLDDDDSLEADSKLPTMLRERSARHQIWLLGSALHRGVVSSICMSPAGALSTRASSDLEQTGSGTFAAESAVFETEHGRIGLCVGPESLHFKVARGLAAAGANLICMSLSLRSDAELALRLPARAVENELYLAVAAHAPRVAEPYPLHMATMPPTEAVAEPHARSQIFAPRGEALARGPIAVAELELPGPDQVDSRAERGLLRRPDLYRASGRSGLQEADFSIPELEVAALAYHELGSVRDAVAWAREHIEDLVAKEVGLIVLPELFCFDANLTDLASEAAADFQLVVQALAVACRRSATHVVTTLVEQVEDAYFHTGLVIGQRGIVSRQVQLHAGARWPWAKPGRRVQTARLPWGTLGLVVGADAWVPELLEGLGRAGADVIAAPLAVEDAQRGLLTLSAAADEAGLAVVAAAPPTRADEGEPQSSNLVVDPTRWPAHRGEAGREVLRATLRLRELRDARLPARTSMIRELTRTPEE